MTPAEVARAKGASDVFGFTYKDTDLADTVVFSAADWGLNSAVNVDLSDAARPALADDGVTSLAGSVTFSVTLFHLVTFSTAHVEWVGSGMTVEYTLDGTTWTAISQNGVINLAGDPDLDIRVSFAGGVVNDSSALTKLSVHVLNTDRILTDRSRTLIFSADKINGSLSLDTAADVSAANDTDEIPDPVGTIEAWITPATTTAITPNPTPTVTNLLNHDQATGLSGTATGGGGVSATGSLDTSWYVHGGSSRRVTENVGGDGVVGNIRWITPFSNERFAVTPGETISAEATINPGTLAGKEFILYVEYFKSDNSYLVSTRVQTVTSLSEITVFRGSTVAPANAAFCHLLVLTNSPTDGGYFMVDALGLYRGALPAAWEPVNSAATYVNGVAGTVTAGVRQHVVRVLDYEWRGAFTVGPDANVEHLAVYPQRMTATEVAELYAAQTPKTIKVNDAGTITVTESNPAVDIYAYSWSIVSGSSS